MLENKIRTPEELKKYMLDLKKWLAQERDKPIEEMHISFLTGLIIMIMFILIIGRKNMLI